MNTCGYVFVCFQFSGCIPGSGIGGSHNCMFSKVAALLYILVLSVWGLRILYMLMNTCYCLFYHSHSGRCTGCVMLVWFAFTRKLMNSLSLTSMVVICVFTVIIHLSVHLWSVHFSGHIILQYKSLFKSTYSTSGKDFLHSILKMQSSPPVIKEEIRAVALKGDKLE